MLKKLLLCVGIASLAILGGEACRATPKPVPPFIPSQSCWRPDASVHLTGKTCQPLEPPQVSCHLFPDLEVDAGQKNFNVIQRAADIFSWQEFIALNWPASQDMRGRPDPMKALEAGGPRVWETWKEISEVFLPGGTRPLDWNQWPTTPPPAACAAVGATRMLVRDQKVDDLLDATVQAVAATQALPATLTDQRGKVVRYEIRMNKKAFDHVVDHRLYDGSVQERARHVVFPEGSMLVKASWRQLSQEEEKTRAFHSTLACVCDFNDSGTLRSCLPTRMGLVGLHITQKTPSAPQWIWSTFEQENNLEKSHGLHASFNSSCHGSKCPPNNQQTPATVPNQVTRAIAIPSKDPDCADPTAAVDNVVRLNRDLSNALKDHHSVFQHYQLINTQWPTPFDGKSSTVFDVRPAFLSNSTQETFVQETSTCMGCHSTARTVNPYTFVSSDFSFSLNDATPAPLDTRILRAPTDLPDFDGPTDPRSKWDKEHWPQILRGHELANSTYELLGRERVNAKLHCSSCHLSAGRDPNAAWWVGMGLYYEHDPVRIANRINGCFERSMNGVALCATPASGAAGDMGECAANPEMNALIAYMNWLDEQWSGGSFSIRWDGVGSLNERFVGRDGGQPARGYPHPLDGGTGNPDAGALVFQQKCAVCHGADGHGRYQDGYYRPALWGKDSFNACAGMNQLDNSMPFLHANMPLGAGGQLSYDEALNVATFVDSQCRPGAPGGCPGPDVWPSPRCVDGGSTLDARGAPVTQWEQ